MSNYKDKTVMLISSPLFCSMAERLGRDFKHVLLYIPVSGSFVTMNQGMVGTGLQNVTKVFSVFGPHFETVDLFVFCDLHHAELQIQLEKMGKRVFGNRNAEELEIYRGLCKEQMEKQGLAVQPWTTVTGIDSLRQYLKLHPNQHVKIDRWRGLTETFFAPDYETVETKLDDIEHKLGGFKNMAEFIVESDLPDRVEIGLDCYCIDGRFPSATLVGIEAKDCGYVAEFVKWADIPKELTEWCEAMTPLLATYGSRGFLSNEIRIGEDKVPYMIDACMRAGSPPSELYQEFYTNLSEIIWEGAGGNLVDPVPKGKFGVQVVLKSSWAAESQWLRVTIDPKWERNLKLVDCVAIEGERYVVPLEEHMPEIGSVIGWGDTLGKAIEMVTEAGESIGGHGIKFSMGSIEQIQKEIEELEKIGVSPFTLDKTSNASQT